MLLITAAACAAQTDTASEQGDLVYVCNGNNVSVLNATDLKVIDVVNFGSDINPGYIALSPDGDMAYVVSITDNRLFFLDTRHWTVTHVTTIGSAPGKPNAVGSAIAVTPDGSRIYVGDYQSNVVHVIDAASYAVIGNVNVEIAPLGLAISPDGSFVYTANSGSGSISVIDTGSNAVVATIAGGNGTFDVRVSPDGSRLYASNWYGGDVMIVDTATRKMLDRIQVSRWIGEGQVGINNMRISPDGDTLYIANARDDTIEVIKTDKGVVTRTIRVGQYPREIELSADGSFLYVSLIGNRSFDAIRLSDDMIIEKSTAWTIPVGIAYHTANQSLIVKPIVAPTLAPTPVATSALAPAPIVTYSPTAVPQQSNMFLWFLNARHCYAQADNRAGRVNP